MRTAVKVLVGLALSVFTLWLFLHNLDLAKVRESLAGANVGLLLIAIFLGYFGHLLTRSWRWATMLRPLKTRISFYNLFSTTAIGYVISWLLPFRLGEVARPVLLARREGIPAAGVLATAGIERILDAATVLLLAAAAALTTPLWWAATGPPALLRLPLLGEHEVVKMMALAGGVVIAGCAIGLPIARAMLAEGAWLPRRLERGVSEASRPARRALWSFARDFAKGATFLQDVRGALRIGAESFVIWSVIGISVWVGLLAAGVHIPFPGVFLLMALSVLAIAIPTPGGMGPVQLFFLWGLTQVFGVEQNLAAAATFLYHPVIVFIPPIVFGLFFAWRDGLRPGSLGALTRIDGATDTPVGGDGTASGPGPRARTAGRKGDTPPAGPKARTAAAPGPAISVPRGGAE